MLLRFAFLAAALAAMSPAQAQSDASRWLQHVKILAADELQGRLTGTPGYAAAAAYVAEQFQKAGIQPAAEQGYEQPVPLIEQYVNFETSALALVHQGRTVNLAIGQQILPGNRVQQLPDSFDAPLVFAGYGLHLPEIGHDDFAGLDLSGKILVILGGGPAEIPGPLKAHASFSSIWPALAQSGALGVITLSDPDRMDIPWERQMLLAKSSGMRLADPNLNDAQQPFFTARFAPADAELLFAQSGRRFADILTLAREGKTLPHFDLGQNLKGHIVAYERTFAAPNIVGRIEGRDTRRKAEYVVLSAHLDHLGIGPAVDGDAIYNGAMDNAAGIASMIETGRKLVAKKPARSVLLVAVTGEERGLLGSRYFAIRPTVAPEAMVANINMDMYLPLWPFTHVTALGATESSLGPLSAEVARSLGVRQIPDRYPERNLFVRSDQYSFVRAGVPALALMFAPTSDAERQIERAWLHDRYHAPSDDLQQPINPAYAAAFNRYLLQLVLKVGNLPERPKWNDDSYFKRFAP